MMSQSEVENYQKLEERLRHWEGLPENAGEKLYWLAQMNGDPEAAKWAFLKSESNQSLNSPNDTSPVLSTGGEPQPNDTQGLAQRIWNGDVNFWKLWFFGSVLPNLIVTPTFAFLANSGSAGRGYAARVHQANQELLTFLSVVIFAYSVFVMVGLTKSTKKMAERNCGPFELVPAIILVGAGWIFIMLSLVLVAQYGFTTVEPNGTREGGFFN